MKNFDKMTFMEMNIYADDNRFTVEEAKLIEHLGIIKIEDRKHICLSCDRVCFIKDEMRLYGKDITKCKFYEEEKR